MLYCARVFAFLAGVGVSLCTLSVQAVTVVASIPPLAMLSQSLLQGTNGVTLVLVNGKQSPHGMSLLPSQRASLEKADLVLWVGEDLESWLVKPLTQLKCGQLAMRDTSSIQLLPATAVQQVKMRQKAEQTGSDEHHQHQGAWDMHLWLDPTIVQAYVGHVRDELMMRDAVNAERYRQNARQLISDIQQADAQAKQLLEPMQTEPLLVMHDAWRYLFRHYGLTQGAMVQKTPEQSIGAASVAQLEQRLRNGELRCLLREPQFEPKAMDWLNALAPNLNVAMTDPLGSANYSGGYAAWLLDQAKAISNCQKRQ
ncbi:MAG: zinc ABC transporter substrate-binding protein [Gammaproteobacteria bacterium]|nr:zinc ABC transporter substrate-binding protein [Gammaproteobacteria bacterium]